MACALLQTAAPSRLSSSLSRSRSTWATSRVKDPSSSRRLEIFAIPRSELINNEKTGRVAIESEGHDGNAEEIHWTVSRTAFRRNVDANRLHAGNAGQNPSEHFGEVPRQCGHRRASIWHVDLKCVTEVNCFLDAHSGVHVGTLQARNSSFI
ncbi:hypothetical protein L596_021606 [Steinernema carpocapsae]|uniref:Uncharacterized protein n=1 Tax=Steinernema carpocapsae TaxID=34508 RepID=A0A4U5MJA5_STECR|nr:hypothetical protein L596_021606 [Steinernema carpocapsae]